MSAHDLKRQFEKFNLLEMSSENRLFKLLLFNLTVTYENWELSDQVATTTDYTTDYTLSTQPYLAINRELAS